MRLATLDDISALRESDEVECKLAQGRDGRGEVPRSLWESYSAFANTAGGYLILGVEEKEDGSFRIDKGIANVSKLRTEFFNLANNPQKVSVCLVQPENFQEVSISGKDVIIIRIPPASRQHRPVFVYGNPLTGTFRRVDEGDRLCSRETVRRMLAEQEDDSRDDRILRGFGLDDLSSPSVGIYRNMLQASSPRHPFLEADPLEFLRKIRAWRKDRETGAEGVTIAGLLMFGTSEAIKDEFPNYALDYQERDEPKADRWTDRITTDGTWSGNIFDFFRLVWRKLTLDIKVPFRLVEGQRQDETSVHVALREALVNCLIHADYTCRSSVLIVKRPDMFGFRNPGNMRVPVESAIRGGESDARNRNLQQMFLMIGAAERAGSGVPKIHMGWREQHWRPPVLREKTEPSEQTLLELRMEDLLPPAVVELLHREFGKEFDRLGAEARIVLATAAVETTVSHARAMTLCDVHPTDMTRLLQSLVSEGFLTKVGQGRGSLYHLVGAKVPDPDTAFALSTLGTLSHVAPEPSDLSSEPSDLEAEPSDLSAEGSDLDAAESDAYLGRWVDGLDLRLVDDLSALDPELLAKLHKIALPAGRGRMQTARVDAILLELCKGQYLSLKVIAKLIGRVEDYLRQNYLNRLVATGQLRRAFPSKPNDPRQAYTTNV
jgi:ATP-dependent DNA helicase RecG